MAIVGAGPIGLAALLTAQFYSPAEIIMIDLDDNRLEVAKRFGATATINSTDGKALETVMKMTGKRGVDTAIEAVGIPATFELCQKIIAPGGTIANIGVHGKKVDLHLEELWDRNISITTRLVDTGREAGRSAREWAQREHSGADLAIKVLSTCPVTQAAGVVTRPSTFDGFGFE